MQTLTMLPNVQKNQSLREYMSMEKRIFFSSIKIFSYTYIHHTMLVYYAVRKLNIPLWVEHTNCSIKERKKCYTGKKMLSVFRTQNQLSISCSCVCMCVCECPCLYQCLGCAWLCVCVCVQVKCDKYGINEYTNTWQRHTSETTVMLSIWMYRCSLVYLVRISLRKISSSLF